MKTEAHCPTCSFPFSFWRVAFAYSAFHFYCKRCRWRIVIGGDREFMWAALSVVAIISIILYSFIVARDLWRLLVLFAIWLVCFEIVAIIFGLIIVNVAQFSRPAESVAEDDAIDGSKMS